MAQLPRLSDSEWDVLKLLLQGKSNKKNSSTFRHVTLSSGDIA